MFIERGLSQNIDRHLEQRPIRRLSEQTASEKSKQTCLTAVKIIHSIAGKERAEIILEKEQIIEKVRDI